jgi:hypothetical protein
MLAANQLLALLPAEASGSVVWDVSSWRFDLLEDGREAREALTECSNAELVVVAAENAPPPIWSQTWLNSWAAGKKIAWSALALVLIQKEGPIRKESGLLAAMTEFAEEQDLPMLVFISSPIGSDGPLVFHRIADYLAIRQTGTPVPCTPLSVQ